MPLSVTSVSSSIPQTVIGVTLASASKKTSETENTPQQAGQNASTADGATANGSQGSASSLADLLVASQTTPDQAASGSSQAITAYKSEADRGQTTDGDEDGDSR
ncbi:MAG TPA: hypothetical protein VK395_30045 [Gemmataceae bacterium]|nr:hypothetical protein [Gemmataceae bacterium]